ncbi:hypothetical protein CEAn_00021 [Coxiella endosymbiont of Amblyomma nuttalli]|nr:hypothetical protein CEAn_00021 [Coxiella endosymbiont of Amblyomma nuttalli]
MEVNGEKEKKEVYYGGNKHSKRLSNCGHWPS